MRKGILAVVLQCLGGMAFAAADDVPSGFEWVGRFVKYEGNPILRAAKVMARTSSAGF